MYVTLLLFAVAALLSSGMVWLFAALLLHWTYVVARVPREELMLLRAFG